MLRCRWCDSPGTDGLLLGNKSRDLFDEAVLKIQLAILAVGENRRTMRFLFRHERFDRFILNLNQFIIANFTIAMARVSIFECLGAKQTPDLIDTRTSLVILCNVSWFIGRRLIKIRHVSAKGAGRK